MQMIKHEKPKLTLGPENSKINGFQTTAEDQNVYESTHVPSITPLSISISVIANKGQRSTFALNWLVGTKTIIHSMISFLAKWH